jgi:hypothetical protein
MGENIHGTRHALCDKGLLPGLGEAKDALHITVQDVDQRLRWGHIGQIGIGPNLKGTVIDGLANLLDVGANDGQIVINENNIGLLRLNDGGKLRKGEPWLLLFFASGGVNDLHLWRISTADVSVDKLLRTEMDDFEPGMCCQLLDEIVDDLAVAIYLAGMRTNNQKGYGLSVWLWFWLCLLRFLLRFWQNIRAFWLDDRVEFIYKIGEISHRII